MQITSLLSIVKSLTLSLLIMSLSACVTAPTNEDTLTTAQLVSIAQQTDRQPVAGEPYLVVGIYNGREVIEEFHCSDLCPQNTTRIMHYKVPENATCDSIGGVTKSILVPIAITVLPREYCFPKAIADYWQSYP